MPRFRLTLEYNGAGLVGWQRQHNGLSVQEMLENAVVPLTGAHAQMFAAGRTDAGVHASGQVVHFDTEKNLPAAKVQDGLNYWLRTQAEEAERLTSVAVIDAALAPPPFHARFSATSRHYVYRIANRRAPPVLTQPFVWWLSRELDAPAMHDAAQILVGHHDFTTFRAAECQANSPMRTLDYLNVEKIGEEVRISAGARSFLHHQVRNLVGTLCLVGSGSWTAQKLQAAFEAKNRARGGPTAPPSGLSLTRVGYEEIDAP